jgi:2-oxoisovalerate dehydrogenase E1 component alpha subunit
MNNTTETSTVAEFKIQKLQYLNENSELTQPLPKFASTEALIQLYELMTTTRAMDTKAVNLQRTGQMSTYPSSRGQEAMSVGVGHALYDDDIHCPFYRDQGTFIQRNIGIDEIFLYWGGDERGNNYRNNQQDLPICVPIASQFLHATGIAFAMQYREQQRAVVVTGGDGSTSQGDFYEAINLAGAWNLPVVFCIYNNEWAISVPRSEQTACKTIAQKAIAAGIEGLQVDGNDVIAMRQATRNALDKARSGGGPTLIEGLSYRLCDHTTADDASRYQPEEEVKAAWKKEPIARLAYYLKQQGAWSKEQEAALHEKVSAEIDAAVKKYLNAPPPKPTDMVEHLYQSLPEQLLEQYQELGEQS